MRDRAGTIAPFAAVAGVLGLCCGVPVLLSLGVLGAIAGLSVQSWVLIGAGLILATVAMAGLATDRGGRAQGCDTGEPATSQDRALDQVPATITKEDHA